jgi:hypothetical protein
MWQRLSLPLDKYCKFYEKNWPNEHSTFWAHFSTMGRIKLREIKVSLHFVHSRSKEKVSCFQVESGVKHHQANCFCLFVLYGYFTGMICGLQKQHSSLCSDSTPNMTTT